MGRLGIEIDAKMLLAIWGIYLIKNHPLGA